MKKLLVLFFTICCIASANQKADFVLIYNNQTLEEIIENDVAGRYKNKYNIVSPDSVFDFSINKIISKVPKTFKLNEILVLYNISGNDVIRINGLVYIYKKNNYQYSLLFTLDESNYINCNPLTINPKNIEKLSSKTKKYLFSKIKNLRYKCLVQTRNLCPFDIPE